MKIKGLRITILSLFLTAILLGISKAAYAFYWCAGWYCRRYPYPGSGSGGW